MSGEFGSYEGGYFHSQIDAMAIDLANGREPLTRAWAPFFETFKPVATAISYVEACDSSPARSILATLDHIAKLKAALAQVEAHVEPYSVVARVAVEQALRERAK